MGTAASAVPESAGESAHKIGRRIEDFWLQGSPPCAYASALPFPVLPHSRPGGLRQAGGDREAAP